MGTSAAHVTELLRTDDGKVLRTDDGDVLRTDDGEVLRTDDGEVLRIDDGEEFLAAFDAFAQAVRRARGAPAQSDGQALTLSQYGLLLGLADRDSARVQELAVDAGIAASTATRILDALERRGIVRRMRADEDRRAVRVTLTSHGQRQLDSQHEWMRARQRKFYASLPDEERELAPDLLIRLAGLIDELAAGP